MLIRSLLMLIRSLLMLIRSLLTIDKEASDETGANVNMCFQSVPKVFLKCS
jgi:hypothetical protein